MSAESTELKFVRCPSCKSLVPSVASRCRMCGHQFDSSVKKEDGAEKTPAKAREIQEEPINTNISAKKNQLVAGDDLDLEDSSVDDSEDEIEDGSESNGDEMSSDDAFPQSRRRRRRRRKSSQNFSESTNTNGGAHSQSSEAPVNSQKMEREPMQTTAVVSNNKNLSRSNSSKGELFAWLIHYGQNSKGEATEIRSGQFFIGRERLRDADIVVSHDSLSTPHVLVKAGIAGGIVIQDLMSEHGTLVKRGGESSYKQHAEPVEVCHGDWLRLGEYEVLVCIVPAKE